MKNHSNDYPFIVRNAAPITLFLVGFICLLVGFVVPESWRPFEPVEDAQWFGIFGIFPLLFGYYLWKLCNPKDEEHRTRNHSEE